MKATLDHIGIAVGDLAEALAFYRDALGLEVEAAEDVASQHMRAHFVPVGGAALELLEATTPDSPIAKYLEKRGRACTTSRCASTTSAPRWPAEGARRAADRRDAAAGRPGIARRLRPPGERPRRARGAEAGGRAASA